MGGCWGGSFSKQQVLVIFFSVCCFLGEAGLAEPMMMQTWAQNMGNIRVGGWGWHSFSSFWCHWCTTDITRTGKWSCEFFINVTPTAFRAIWDFINQNFTYLAPGLCESSSVTAKRPSISSSLSVGSNDLTSAPAS